MKRTKRYGGFLVGDRVQRKDGLFKNLYPGIITAMNLGRLTVQWVDLNHKIFNSCFYPKDLINPTRQKEERLVPKSEMNERLRKQAEQELSEMYGVEQPIIDNPALKESKENITHISEETANELNSMFKEINKHINGTWNFVRPYPYNKDFSSTADY